jgi:hypothetical protein
MKSSPSPHLAGTSPAFSRRKQRALPIPTTRTPKKASKPAARAKPRTPGRRNPKPNAASTSPRPWVCPPSSPRAPTDGSDHIEVEVSWADYVPEEISEERSDKTKRGWKRVPRGPYTVKVPLDEKLLASKNGVRWPESTGICFRGELRTTDMDGLEPGTRVLSLFLLNDRQALDRDRDINFVFQVRFTMRYPRGFVPRPNRRGEDANNYDPRVLALLFRDKCEWAVGHNTSLALPAPDREGNVTELSTTQLPRYEVRSVKHETVPGIVTGMMELAEMDGPALTNALTPLIEEYAAWIQRQRDEYLERDELGKTRTLLMDEAGRARARMAEGIALLETGERVREAFKMANRAMHVAAKQADSAREDPRYTGEKQPQWRPFQLAFLLLNLASVADPNHDDRKVADLIYFPTGGGKTEAYLGLIAFTLLLRRLDGLERPDEGRGVAVVLRYTLRLLTLDQLGRAATLMCALEEMRKKAPKVLGNARFTVGLWVGKAATANQLKDVHAQLNDYTSALLREIVHIRLHELNLFVHAPRAVDGEDDVRGLYGRGVGRRHFGARAVLGDDGTHARIARARRTS